MRGNKGIVEDVKLQFARQLYQTCLELHGADHQQTRLLREYIAELENRNRSSQARLRGAVLAEPVAVPITERRWPGTCSIRTGDF